MAWLSGWTYRKSITLSRASGLVTNYQMKLLVGESSGATGEDVDCGGKCLSTFNDLRFTTSDGSTLLDYWIESISGTTPNGLATIWIEFDSIGTGDTTFYMYYGKADAAAYSNGDDTFIFFDHFDGDLSKWSGDTSYASIGSSILTFKGPSVAAIKQIYSITTAGKNNFAVRVLGKLKSQSGCEDLQGAAKSDASHRAGIYCGGTATIRLLSKDGTTESYVASNWTSDVIKLRDILVIGGTNIRCFEEGVELSNSPKTTNPPDSADMAAWFLTYNLNAVNQADWILLRNYEATEPAWGSWGSEEASENIIPIPVASLILTAYQGIQIFPIFAPASSLFLSGYAPIYIAGTQVECVELIITPHAPSTKIKSLPPLASLTLTAKLPSYVWSIPANLRPAAQVIYTCTLTGDGESPAVSDLTLPMSSFQGRMRDGDPSYISAVIPNCMVYADDILARQNGDIVIKKGYRFQDGTTQLEEIARVDFESVRIDQGSKSASATISGHKTISSSSVKTITVEGVSYYCLQADGKRRVRALLDLFLRIGDTCIYGSGASDYMTVGYITYTVSVNQTIMEVTEA